MNAHGFIPQPRLDEPDDDTRSPHELELERMDALLADRDAEISQLRARVADLEQQLGEMTAGVEEAALRVSPCGFSECVPDCPDCGDPCAEWGSK